MSSLAQFLNLFFTFTDVRKSKHSSQTDKLLLMTYVLMANDGPLIVHI